MRKALILSLLGINASVKMIELCLTFLEEMDGTRSGIVQLSKQLYTKHCPLVQYVLMGVYKVTNTDDILCCTHH